MVEGVITILAEAGARGWDFVATKGAPYNSDAFVEAYAEAIGNAVDLTLNLGGLNKEQVSAAMIGVLRSTAAAVQAYHRKGVVNANYMVWRNPTEELFRRSKFTMKDRRADSFAGFLDLMCWAKANDVLPTDFVLPIEQPDGPRASELLFGAPSAYVNKKADIIGNTLRLGSRLRAQDHRIKAEILDYFQAKKDHLRSFASMPVVQPGTDDHIIGVVNVQSNRRMLFGLFPGNQKKLMTALAPLLHILSIQHARLSELDHAV